MGGKNWVGDQVEGGIYSEQSKNSPAVLHFWLLYIEFFTLASMTSEEKYTVIQIVFP